MQTHVIPAMNRGLGAVVLLVVFSLLLPRPAAAYGPNTAELANKQWQASFIPPGITSVYWTQTTTSYLVDHPDHPSIEHRDGCYKAPDHFRRTISTDKRLIELDIQNGNQYLMYRATPNTYYIHRESPFWQMTNIFCPTDVHEAAFLLSDLTGSMSTRGEYNGVPCIVEEYDFTRAPSLIQAKVLLYRAQDSHLEIARVTNLLEEEQNGKQREYNMTREFEYNVPISDDLFTFTPPPGAQQE